jgi:hypothetical protein
MLSEKERNSFPVVRRLASTRPLWRVHKMTAFAALFNSGAVDVDKSAGEAVRVVRVEGDQFNVVN